MLTQRAGERNFYRQDTESVEFAKPVTQIPVSAAVFEGYCTTFFP